MYIGFTGENLQRPTVKAYIDAKMAEIESHKIADAKEAMEGISAGEMIAGIGKGIDEISKEVQVPVFVLVMFFILMAILGCLNALLMFFAGSSIGQLFHRSKGACGIAAGIGLYYVSQIASLAAVLIGVLLTEAISAVPEFAWFMGGACLVALIWTVFYYMICRVIVKKHLNLE